MHFSKALRPVRPRALFQSSVSSRVFSPGHHSELSQDPEDLRQLLCQNRNNGKVVIIGRHTHAALLNALAVSAVGRQAPQGCGILVRPANCGCWTVLIGHALQGCGIL